MAGESGKENVLGFEIVVQGVSFYGKISYQDVEYLVLISEKGEYWVERDCSVDESSLFAKSSQRIQLERFYSNEHELMTKKIFFIDTFIIYQVDSTSKSFNFCLHDIFKLTTSQI